MTQNAPAFKVAGIPLRELDEISLLLGELKKGIQNLERRAELAELQRAEIQTRLDGIESVSARVSELERRAKSTEGAVSVHEKWRQQGIGANKVLGVIGGFIGSAITLAVQYLIAQWGHR